MSGGGGGAPSGGGASGGAGSGDTSGGGGASGGAGSGDTSGGGGTSGGTGGGGGSTSGGGDTSGGAGGGGSTPGGGSGDTSGGTGGGSGDSGGSQGGSGGGKITKEQLQKAVKSAGYTPNPKYLDIVLKKTNEKIPNKDEAAMFIAQLIHESGGLNHIEEIACKNGSCKGKYGSGAPGKDYHGRGFIQLTWGDNYKAASKGLGMGTQLYDNPEKVSQDPNIAMDVSVWFWKTRVASQPGVKNMQFGATTKAINGPIECGGKSQTPQKRYQIYLKVAEAFGIKKKATSDGC
ncbi:UNVERIFIED_CONTAM: hypothetical protein PYX00_011459 [Menopon gallinae]|uniref:Glycoside hydrolase family 19 catalytic domain-containing protein n=1 Tax=Menopon gallinae TaxID=328185 RepID=A0AAW2H7Q9_9NEOP